LNSQQKLTTSILNVLNHFFEQSSKTNLMKSSERGAVWRAGLLGEEVGWWKGRWGQLAAADDLGEDGRANAREALEAMREAESSSWGWIERSVTRRTMNGSS
jgi:hypothetical protein